MSQQEYFDQLKSFLGQPVEVEDPSNPDQCMDFAFKWCDILGIDRVTIRHKFAHQAWHLLNDLTIEKFEFIPNTPTGVPQMGDIPIWDEYISGVTGEAGHIAIATGKGDANSFTSLDQNWNSVQKVVEVQHSYTGVLGWLRPRLFKQAEIDKLRYDRDGNYNLFVASQAQLGEANTKLIACLNRPIGNPVAQVPNIGSVSNSPVNQSKNDVQSNDNTNIPGGSNSNNFSVLRFLVDVFALH